MRTPDRTNRHDTGGSAPPTDQPTEDTSVVRAEPETSTKADIPTRMRLVAGAACCVSGIALVVHILTGSPLWLVLTGLGFTFTLAVVAVSVGDPVGLRRLRALAGAGLLVGVVGTAAYDGARWLLVQVGGMELSPFEALPLFGQALLGEGDGPAVVAAGIGYHLLNGIAFGVAYVIWFGHRSWWWGVVFAFGLEAAMLAVYPGWLDPASIAELTQVSLVGHVAYGVAMGLTASRAVPWSMRRADAAIDVPNGETRDG